MTSATVGRAGLGTAHCETARTPLPALPSAFHLRLHPPAVLGAALLLAWWAITRVGAIPPVFLPSPSAVARRLVLAFAQGGMAGYTWVTLREALLGCLAAAALSLPLAWTLYRSRRFSRAVLPYVAASQAVPAIAIAPLLVVWIGYGTVPTVVLCVLMVFFPITVTVLLGLRGLDTDVIDAARLDGAHGVSMLLYMELPMALPSILSGLRTGFTLSVTGAVIGEMTMGGEGLGMVLASQRQAVDTTGLFSTIVVLCVIATTIHWVLHELERRSRVVASMRGRSAT
ncbi:MAG: ABC transporter permease [Actinomyces ruminicola]|uniref:NitT/TauT family transport system permease protein n=1 Tax=Actinomyces ruminicola TaxID=332524 RepID=A0A1G9UPG5_9ACTO|nr:ABC transporter permease [Actinomyces ruminicola]MBE6482117.1 ABC transporter permease [Actinomyces ruminicola]SDM61445.1 NitT/TauT family transport system permease protein [Actinomyces ruminicola]SDN62741.1 NitT/TauT family transport system permease protein [Actinomyces ruminicola]